MSRYNQHLNDKGQCFNCLVKPLVYKTPSLHYYCPKCSREYDGDGKFRPNFMWEDEYLMTDRPIAEHQEQRKQELEMRERQGTA